MNYLKKLLNSFFKAPHKSGITGGKLKGILALAESFQHPDDAKGDYKWFRVEPQVFYPAMVAILREEIKGPRPSDSYLDGIYSRLLQIPVSDFDFIKLTVEEADEIGVRERRGFVLESARLWFTHVLQTEMACAVGLKILKVEGNHFKL